MIGLNVSFLAGKLHIPVEVIRHADEVGSPDIRGLLSCCLLYTSNIRYIENPTEKVQSVVLNADRDAAPFISSPTEEIKRLAMEMYGLRPVSYTHLTDIMLYKETTEAA